MDERVQSPPPLPVSLNRRPSPQLLIKMPGKAVVGSLRSFISCGKPTSRRHALVLSASLGAACGGEHSIVTVLFSTSLFGSCAAFKMANIKGHFFCACNFWQVSNTQQQFYSWQIQTELQEKFILKEFRADARLETMTALR